MDQERWRRIEALFERALEQQPAMRDAWLEIECGADRELWLEVREMLAADSTRSILDDFQCHALSCLVSCFLICAVPRLWKRIEVARAGC